MFKPATVLTQECAPATGLLLREISCRLLKHQIWRLHCTGNCCCWQPSINRTGLSPQFNVISAQHSQLVQDRGTLAGCTQTHQGLKFCACRVLLKAADIRFWRSCLCLEQGTPADKREVLSGHGLNRIIHEPQQTTLWPCRVLLAAAAAIAQPDSAAVPEIIRLICQLPGKRSTPALQQLSSFAFHWLLAASPMLQVSS